MAQLKKRYIISFILFISITVLMSLSLNLTEQEAYYWSWSKHLDLSYFDHPPLIAWAIYLWTKIFSESVTSLKIFAFILHLGTLYFTYVWLRKKISNTVSFLALFVPLILLQLESKNNFLMASFLGLAGLAKI